MNRNTLNEFAAHVLYIATYVAVGVTVGLAVSAVLLYLALCLMFNAVLL